MGDNINGPSLIRVPNWLPGKAAEYYLYFSHHSGRYIRLAVADQLEGPWRIHTPGVLSVTDSLFVDQDIVSGTQKIDQQGTGWGTQFEEPFYYAHVASPHVLIDENAKLIRMYYHGLLANADQGTRVATSMDGLNFEPRKPILGPPYFRVFQYLDIYYAISWGGELWRSGDWYGPFEKGPSIVPDYPDSANHHGFRHGEIFVRDDNLYIFYSRIGDCPERIVYCRIKLSPDWNDWKVLGSGELLEPEFEWEGANLPLQPSTIGAAENREYGLRDPCVFRDQDGETYLLYSVAAESGIGIARLSGFN